jgi:hypothetical protein
VAPWPRFRIGSDVFLSFIKRLIHSGAATLYGVTAKLANGLNWLVVAAVVSTHLSKVAQGFFFTFLSLVAIQMLFDLGLGTAIVQFAAHEWALYGEKGLDERLETPEAARLGSLLRFAAYWYSAAAATFFLVLQVVGYVLFAGESPDGGWFGAWVLLTFMVAVDLALMGPWSVLEGCNRVATVYLYRALKAVVLGIVIWAALLKGCGLYSLGLGYLAVLPLSIGMLRGRSWELLRWLLSRRGHQMNWKAEILPLQWRLAVSFGSGYFAQWGVTPITFKLFNPALAGQFGLMWSIIMAISGIANVVVTVRAPQFGALIASRRYAELDRLAWKTGVVSVLIAWMGCAVVSVAIYLLNRTGSPLAERVLPLAPAMIMLGATALAQVLNPLAIYLRSHKREPYLWLSAGFAAGVVLATCLGGRWFGPIGVAVSYFVLVACYFVPVGSIIFLRCRDQWHACPS